MRRATHMLIITARLQLIYATKNMRFKRTMRNILDFVTAGQ